MVCAALFSSSYRLDLDSMKPFGRQSYSVTMVAIVMVTEQAESVTVIPKLKVPAVADESITRLLPCTLKKEGALASQANANVVESVDVTVGSGDVRA
jgi:hypothetical protein